MTRRIPMAPEERNNLSILLTILGILIVIATLVITKK